MTVVFAIGGVTGCCQVTVIASPSSCATATTLEGQEGTPTSEGNDEQRFYQDVHACI